MTPVLELSGISKRYGGVAALSGVSLELKPGEVHALMGENGAGKSTLMKVASGLLRPDAGTIRVEGAERAFRGPSEAQAAGVRTVFQELTVLPNLDVAHNLLIGAEPHRLGGLMDRPALYAQAGELLERLGIGLDPHAAVARLATGARQMLEIARAVARTPRALILDEPTSSLGRQEEEALFGLMARLKAEGTGIFYITHRMSEVFRLADRITVLRDGRHVATGPASDFDRPRLIAAMVGRVVEERRPAAAVARVGPVALSLRGLSRGRHVGPVDLDLHAGEVLGLGGLMGAGRSELARLMGGVDRPTTGGMLLQGRPFAPRSVAQAVRAGVAYLPEDRKTEGLVLDLAVGRNLQLPSLRRETRAGVLNLGGLSGLTRDWMARLGVKAASPGVGVATLSGGNQQKVVLAKWLATGPKVVLLDEPTRGVDVGAKAEIHALIRSLAADGAAVLVISSELPELLAVADRIAVMARGRLSGIVPAEAATEAVLLDLAFREDPVCARTEVAA